MEFHLKYFVEVTLILSLHLKKNIFILESNFLKRKKLFSRIVFIMIFTKFFYEIRKIFFSFHALEKKEKKRKENQGY